MAGRVLSFSSLVDGEQKLAYARLVELFRKYDNSTLRVAKALGVSKPTVIRWVNKLVAAGFDDPGNDKRCRGGRKKKLA